MGNFSEDLTMVLINTDIQPHTRVEFPLVYSKEFLEEPVDNLQLKTRAINALKRARIMTMTNLLDCFEDINHLRGCGVDTAKEIKNAFLDYWYDTLNPESKTRFWEEFIKVNERRYVI